MRVAEQDTFKFSAVRDGNLALVFSIRGSFIFFGIGFMEIYFKEIFRSGGTFGIMRCYAQPRAMRRGFRDFRRSGDKALAARSARHGYVYGDGDGSIALFHNRKAAKKYARNLKRLCG